MSNTIYFSEANLVRDLDLIDNITVKCVPCCFTIQAGMSLVCLATVLHCICEGKEWL